MLKKDVILLALNIVRLVNTFENYNEYLGSITTKSHSDIYSVLDPWAGVEAGQFDHNPDDDGDTDDYNKEPLGGEVNHFRRFLLNFSELRENVILKENKETDFKRVKRASKRTIGSILRARGKTTPGTEFSSEEVEGSKKGGETAEKDTRKDEIKDYDDKSEEKKMKDGKIKSEVKRKEVKEIDLSLEKKNGDRINERPLSPITSRATKKSTTEELPNVMDAMKERNYKIRKEIEMWEEDENNRILRADAIKNAEEDEAAKKSAYMLDSGDKSSGKGDKESEEKMRPVKPNRKKVGRRSYDLTKLKIMSSKNSKKKINDKYAMTITSGESRKNNKTITTIKNADRSNSRRIVHRKIRRSNAQNVRRDDSNNDSIRKVNYREKARENLQAYRDHNEKAVSVDRKVDPLLIDLKKTVNDLASKRKPESQATAADDRKVDPLLADLKKTVNDIAGKHNPKNQMPADDRKVDPLLADLKKAVNDIAGKRKPKSQDPADNTKEVPLLADLKKTVNDLASKRNSESQTLADDRRKDPLLADLNKTVNDLASKRKPVSSAPADDKKVDPLLADLKKTVNDLVSIRKPESQISADDRKKAPLLADLKKTVNDLASKRKPENQAPAANRKENPQLADLKKTDNDLASKRKPENQAPANDRKEDPLLADLKKTVNNLASERKPESQASSETLKNSRRRRGREIFQIPNIAVLDNDYSMYVNDKDYEDGRRNNIDQNNDVQVSVDTVITPNKMSTSSKQSLKYTSIEKLNKIKDPKTNKSETIKMIISTNLSSMNPDDKPGEEVADKKNSNEKSMSGNDNDISESPVNDDDKSRLLTTELPLKTIDVAHKKTAVSKKRGRFSESSISSMKLYGPVIGGNNHRNHKAKIQHKLKSEKDGPIKLDDGDSAKTLIGPVLSSKFSQTAPIHNNYNIENLFVLGPEFIKLTGKPSKRSSCHKILKKPVEITVNVESIKDGVHTIVEPLTKYQGGSNVAVNSNKVPKDKDNNSEEMNNNQISQNPINLNGESNKGNGDDVLDKSNGDDGNTANGITKEGQWAKLISKLADSGFLDIAADYTPKKFDPNDYSRSDSGSNKDASSGEYEPIKKHKNHTKDAPGGKKTEIVEDKQDEIRRHHSHLRFSQHSHHKKFKNVLRLNLAPKHKQRQTRFIKEDNKFDALTNIVVKYGKYLESLPNNKGNTLSKETDNGKTETINMNSYLKELKYAFRKHFHGLVQYDWLATAVDTESSLMKLLRLMIQVINKKEILRRDLTLLNYVKFLFESAVREFPDYIIENTLQAYMPSGVIEEAAVMTEKAATEKPLMDKKPRPQSEEIFETPNSKYLFREYYIPEPYRRDDKTLFSNYFDIKKEDKEKNVDDKTIIDTKFKEFLIETQSNLAELHVLFALTPNEPNPDDWVTIIQTLFIAMNNHQRLKYTQILLHMFAADLFDNIDNFLNYPNLSLYDIIRDNANQVKENVNDMILILKILTYIRLI